MNQIKRFVGARTDLFFRQADMLELSRVRA